MSGCLPRQGDSTGALHTRSVEPVENHILRPAIAKSMAQSASSTE